MKYYLKKYDYIQNYIFKDNLEYYNELEQFFEEIIKYLNKENLEWFPIEGTLIACLRYGKHYKKNSERYNLSDMDIDIAIICNSENDITNKLKSFLESI